MEFKVCVVGLGYVGLPLAHLLSSHFEVHGYDINNVKIESFIKGVDPTKELGEELKNTKILFHNGPIIIS